MWALCAILYESCVHNPFLFDDFHVSASVSRITILYSFEYTYSLPSIGFLFNHFRYSLANRYEYLYSFRTPIKHTIKIILTILCSSTILQLRGYTHNRFSLFVWLRWILYQFLCTYIWWLARVSFIVLCNAKTTSVYMCIYISFSCSSQAGRKSSNFSKRDFSRASNIASLYNFRHKFTAYQSCAPNGFHLAKTAQKEEKPSFTFLYAK